jgi:hypothetical protein
MPSVLAEPTSGFPPATARPNLGCPISIASTTRLQKRRSLVSADRSALLQQPLLRAKRRGQQKTAVKKKVARRDFMGL